jgi:NTP pyrophosphatase (non-canonical NTP hydrolase)
LSAGGVHAEAEAGGGLERLLVLVRRLRDPSGGCPWDRQQELASFARFLRDEATELEQALASGDPNEVADEVGDCLWVASFLLGVAEERGLSVDEVLKSIEAKITRRHPHVFGSERATTPEEAEAIYRRVKAEERCGRSS